MRLKMRDWNYRHRRKCRGGKCGTKQLAYGKPKHVVVAAHRKSSVQLGLFVRINNVANAFILVAWTFL